jgi:signal transduction histidine kinase
VSWEHDGQERCQQDDLPVQDHECRGARSDAIVRNVSARLRYGLLLAAALAAPVAVGAALFPLRGHISATNVALLMIVPVASVAFGSLLAAILAAASAALAFDFFWTPPLFTLNTYGGQDLIGTAVYLGVGLVIGGLASQSRQRRRAEELASEQAALRRVATLVAKDAPEGKVFTAAAEEVGRLARASTAQVFRYEQDGSVVRLAVWGSGTEDLTVSARYPAGGHDVATMVLRSGRPARVDGTAAGLVPVTRQTEAVIGDPIFVDGRLWGLVMVTTSRPGALPGDAEERIAGFTELVATAAQRRGEMIASRKRIVAAGDQTRRRIERNLHDGAQQQIVTLALTLRAAWRGIPGDLTQTRAEVRRVEEGLKSVLDELREISHGLHPAVLSEHGLGPAMKSLARRAAMPVNLDLQLAGRLPEQVEAGAYYLVSEALANTAKHANASAAEVRLSIDHGVLVVHVRDDGDGGADPAKGSGITGMRDRVEALGGRVVLRSPLGEGTSVLAEFPLGTPGGDGSDGPTELDRIPLGSQRAAGR